MRERKAVHPRFIASVLDVRLRYFEKTQDVAGCRQTAEMWEHWMRTDADSLYHAACMRAVTAAVIAVTFVLWGVNGPAYLVDLIAAYCF